MVVLNEDLDYKHSFILNNYRPRNVKVLNDVACVRMGDADIICFYDLKKFNEIKRYDHNGIIGVSKQGFIQYDYLNKSFYCYDYNGYLIDQIRTKNDFGYTSHPFGSIVVNESSNKIILCHHRSSNVIII